MRRILATALLAGLVMALVSLGSSTVVGNPAKSLASTGTRFARAPDEQLRSGLNVITRAYAQDQYEFVIDGLGDDWDGYTPAAVDPTGDSVCGAGTDLTSVYYASTPEYLYIMQKVADDSAGEGWFHFHIDKNSGSIQHYVLNLTSSSCTLYNEDTWEVVGYPVGAANVVAEARIPWTMLESPQQVDVWPVAPGPPCDAFSTAIVILSPTVCGGSVDVVFAMDTSGSMDDEFSTLCNTISDVVAELAAQGITVKYEILGINDTRGCATQSVSGLIPGGTVDHIEDWGPAVVDLSNHYAWEPGYTRLIIPMSDEGPQNGTPEEDPGPDRDVINQACAVAQANNVLVSPVQGTAAGSAGDPAKVEQLMRDLAACTGGLYFRSTDPASDLADGITYLIGASACTPVIDSISPDCDITASTLITITGQNFLAGVIVGIRPVGGGSWVPADNVTIVSDTQITFQVPSSLTRGEYEVRVTNLGIYHSSIVTIWVGEGTCGDYTVYFEPQHSSASFCNTTNVDIKVDAADFKAGQIKFTYNSTCADVTGWARNTSDFPMGMWESGTPGEEWITFSADDSMTGIYTIGTLTIHCESQEDCTTALDFVVGGSGTSKLFNEWGSEISATWQDGTFECTTGLCGDVAPYPGCDGQVNMGDVSLLHSYVGHPGQYSLCCEPCGDVAPYPSCDGQINMGDVSLLHSYVGHPGQYNLCCEAASSATAASAVLTAAENEVNFVPQESNAPFCETAEVEIQVDATDFKSGQIKFTYDSTCADVTGWARNTSDFPMGTWESETASEEWITFSASDSTTGTYSIGTLTIHCESQEECTTTLDFVVDGPGTSKLFDDWGSEISATWVDGAFRRGMSIYLPLVFRNYSP